MASTVISSIGELVLAAAVFVVGMMVAVAVAAWWLRRRWRRLQLVVIRRFRRLAAEHSESALRWALSRPFPDRRWRMIWQARRHLARSVAGAEHAVDLALSSGSPMGDMERMCRRLGPAALDLDRALRVAQRGGGRSTETDDLVCQAKQLASAASTLRQAALSSVTYFPARRWADLAEEIDLEAQAVRAGQTSLWAAPGQPRSAGSEVFDRLSSARR